MKLILDTPTRVRLEDVTADEESALRKFLTYKNKAAMYELARLKKNPWYIAQHGHEKYQEEIERLKKAIDVCLLYGGLNDDFSTYSGLTEAIIGRFKESVKVQNNITYPEPGNIPWAKMPTGQDRYYQVEAHDALLKVKHGAVSIATGLGKTRIIRNLTKTLSLKTLIVAPSVSIARQLLKDLSHHLGIKRVGLFGDGKKDFKKLITVGLFQSLSNVEKGSPEWEELSKCEVFIVDESHLTPASTLKHVCDGIAANAPYRFFFSGTQMRNDGADLLLKGIIGPIVYSMTVEEGVDKGFLSKPNFNMVEMASPSTYISNNPDSMLDKHYYKNPAMYQKAAEIANKSVEVLGHQVLILIEEVAQFQYLIPYLRHKVKFAHGGVTKVNKKFVPDMYHDSDPETFVDEFNNGEFPILVGTSCISIGTDIRTPKTLINLQGGTSEVKIRQAIGRGTRRQDDKDQFNYFDFCVTVNPPNMEGFESITERHAQVRRAIYYDVYPNVKVIK